MKSEQTRLYSQRSPQGLAGWVGQMMHLTHASTRLITLFFSTTARTTLSFFSAGSVGGTLTIESGQLIQTHRAQVREASVMLDPAGCDDRVHGSDTVKSRYQVCSGYSHIFLPSAHRSIADLTRRKVGVRQLSEIRPTRYCELETHEDRYETTKPSTVPKTVKSVGGNRSSTVVYLART